MNQILVTEKLYVTPELKRKKRLYKATFILSILLIITLTSIYVYATYDRNKGEEISKDLLSEINLQTENIIEEAEVVAENEEDKVWRIIISTIEEIPNEEPTENIQNIEEEEEEKKEEAKVMTITHKGKEYETVGKINIPKIKVNYPILSEASVELLKISPCKFYGPEPNEIGNFCVAGHNYKTEQFFSKVLKLVVGDVIEITDVSGRTIKYSVFDKYEVVPEDTSCTSQDTNGKKIVTLITCTNDNKRRVIIHAKEIE